MFHDAFLTDISRKIRKSFNQSSKPLTVYNAESGPLHGPGSAVIRSTPPPPSVRPPRD